MSITTVTWVTWRPRGRDLYTNPRAKTAHAVSGNVRADDISNGSFRTACGRYAPDGFDAYFSVVASGKRCKRCEAAVR